MSWTALVPLKAAAARKSRLSDSLSSEARLGLSETLLQHLLDVLAGCPDVGRIAVLSEIRPSTWSGEWLRDRGGGLNAELGAAARELGGERLLIIHADLPAVSPDDIAALIFAATGGVAIAPDRHGAGTNAIALSQASGFSFAFGPGSFNRHREHAARRARIVKRPGLALDIDTPADLAAALALRGLDRRVVLALTESVAPP
jgi:2-phospho-L-lactate guanylyltransferase